MSLDNLAQRMAEDKRKGYLSNFYDGYRNQREASTTSQSRALPTDERVACTMSAHERERLQSSVFARCVLNDYEARREYH